ncbi:hypothetical protein SAMN03159341_13920 [Paenibacillus sp. 1_12]|nr:hypothetical protein SAMN03159341_13920 [Paenibacillus sp. 1_12]
MKQLLNETTRRVTLNIPVRAKKWPVVLQISKSHIYLYLIGKTMQPIRTIY